NSIEFKCEMTLKLIELRKIVVLLEKLSLVNFANIEGVKRLEEAIKFADRLKEVNTDGVKPMYSVLENDCLYLREDKPEKFSRKLVQQNASLLIEDYFVAPPGNVPLQVTADYFEKKAIKKV
ncbi:hypothetical protein B4U79_01057, partial [Dinothrombium tinctorium]